MLFRYSYLLQFLKGVKHGWIDLKNNGFFNQHYYDRCEYKDCCAINFNCVNFIVIKYSIISI